MLVPVRRQARSERPPRRAPAATCEQRPAAQWMDVYGLEPKGAEGRNSMEITDRTRTLTSYEGFTDEMLLQWWRGGDRAAGDELLRRCKPILHAFFRRRTTEGADELVQLTLVACIHAISHYEGRSSFK